ncbi:hypothetical protein [Cryptosporangium phraense]|uniref:Uncharacterized protein n=1 Tax=Cryptosporangium phraense TaxID=2593070 RepID=A0A545AI61_9ACTN|nr:hypothetical protein [Cryptosporangium phraense]TQS41009.1 hypothetical protein FL583_32040 [Cryptosporangium phraense]
MVCAIGGLFLVSGNDKEQASNATAPAANPPAAPTAAPTPGSTADVPTFKKMLPVIVTGAVFDQGEQVSVIAEPGWPFAFRVPTGWRCTPAQIIDGDASAGLECRPPGESNTLVQVGLRACDRPCDPTTQDLMNRDIAPAPLTEGDASTSYAEVADGRDNRYGLLVSHFFGPQPGEQPTWQVVVRARSPHTDRAAVQKVANDIRTQTP